MKQMMEENVQSQLLKQLICTRRSIRRYLPEQVSRELVEEILQSSLWAPSSHHRQPWRFDVLIEPSDKIRLARAMGEALRSDRMRDGDHHAEIEADVGKSYARLTEAPVLIVVFATTLEMDKYPDAKRAEAEYLMAVQSTAMAVQNVLLSAHAAGLGACWMCAPLFCKETVVKTLGVPPDWQPQAILTLGYPLDGGRLRNRKTLMEVVWKRE